MTKFYTLVILNDFTMVRIWMDNSVAATLLKEKQCAKIYRTAYDQEAILMPDDSIMWRDVPTIDKLGN